MQKKERNLALSVLAVLVLALVPLYLISGYAHPSVDDYSYGKFASLIWAETGSLPAVFANAWERTAHTYQTWQGTFSSIFLMRLQPAVFGEEYYFLTTVLLLTLFLLASILFYMAFFVKLFGASGWQGLILSCILNFGAVEFTHVPSDSFYWYNGGVTYTFFYAMQALLFALLLFLYCAKRRAVKIMLGIICVITAFFTCGGNYVTSLVTVEILCFACILLFLKNGSTAEKKKESRYQFTVRFQNMIKGIFSMAEPQEMHTYYLTLIFFLLTFAAAAAGFLTAVLAPGNAVRQAEVGKAMNPLFAIGLSFVYGAYSIGNCMQLPVLMLLLACIPLMAVIGKNSSFSFRCPGVVTFFSYCLYSSQITPVIYAQGLKIPYRIMNIIYFSCFVMAAVNLFYWIGYFGKKETTSVIVEKAAICHQKKMRSFYAIVFLLFCFTAAGEISIKADMDADGKAQVEITEMPASVSAVYSLINGEARQYDKEAWERYQLYADDSMENVVVSEFSVKPAILFHSDITENPKNWKNQCVKKYFDKKSVKLK